MQNQGPPPHFGGPEAGRPRRSYGRGTSASKRKSNGPIPPIDDCVKKRQRRDDRWDDEDDDYVL